MSSKNALGLRRWWRRHFQDNVVPPYQESLQQIGLLLRTINQKSNRETRRDAIYVQYRRLAYQHSVVLRE